MVVCELNPPRISCMQTRWDSAVAKVNGFSRLSIIASRPLFSFSNTSSAAIVASWRIELTPIELTRCWLFSVGKAEFVLYKLPSLFLVDKSSDCLLSLLKQCCKNHGRHFKRQDDPLNWLFYVQSELCFDIIHIVSIMIVCGPVNKK